MGNPVIELWWSLCVLVGVLTSLQKPIKIKLALWLGNIGQQWAAHLNVLVSTFLLSEHWDQAGIR